MSHDPNAEFDHAILDKIEFSPNGVLPVTPAYQDALNRLYASHQVYANADHKGGHVTVRSLARLPFFHAHNLDAFIAGQIGEDALETNASIYDRYVKSLPAARRAPAEGGRVMVIGKPAQHRAHHGTVVHDPMHTLFLVPGAGPNPGLPGNYLHGSVFHVGPDEASGSWVVHIHDAGDGAAVFSAPTLPEALVKLQEVFASAPFHLSELDALGFKMT